MNQCILMAEIIQDPQLRYTPDTQTAIAEMLVQFPGMRADDPPATLKVVGWGNLAQEIQERYHQGNRVVIEGRLNMNTIDRQEGFKEKRAELTAQRIHLLGAGTDLSSAPTSNVGSTRTPDFRSQAPAPTAPSNLSGATRAPEAAPKARTAKPPAPPVTAEPDYDDIPF